VKLFVMNLSKKLNFVLNVCKSLFFKSCLKVISGKKINLVTIMLVVLLFSAVLGRCLVYSHLALLMPVNASDTSEW